MQCIFLANMADKINTPEVATPNEGKFESFYALFRWSYMARFPPSKIRLLIFFITVQGITLDCCLFHRHFCAQPYVHSIQRFLYIMSQIKNTF